MLLAESLLIESLLLVKLEKSILKMVALLALERQIYKEFN